MAKPKQGEPSRVLVRFYGQIHGEGALEALLTESVIFTLLSERKLGPKLHGIFPGGRLEEFIPVGSSWYLSQISFSVMISRGRQVTCWRQLTCALFVSQARPLRTKELADPEISSIIAEKMAQVHSLDVPISKEPTWIWDMMNRWRNNIKLTLSSQLANSQETRISSAIYWILQRQLDEEIEWMRRYLGQLRSPVVFCHNVFIVPLEVPHAQLKIFFSNNRTCKRATFLFANPPTRVKKSLS